MIAYLKIDILLQLTVKRRTEQTADNSRHNDTTESSTNTAVLYKTVSCLSRELNASSNSSSIGRRLEINS